MSYGPEAIEIKALYPSRRCQYSKIVRSLL